MNRDISDTVTAKWAKGTGGPSGHEYQNLVLDVIGGGMNEEPVYVVRRITPLEAERLQAFPDGYTNIEYNGKPAPDSLRYRVLGNSMTVSVMKWIAQRILKVEENGNETNTRL